MVLDTLLDSLYYPFIMELSKHIIVRRTYECLGLQQFHLWKDSDKSEFLNELYEYYRVSNIMK